MIYLMKAMLLIILVLIGTAELLKEEKKKYPIPPIEEEFIEHIEGVDSDTIKRCYFYSYIDKYGIRHYANKQKKDSIDYDIIYVDCP